MKRCICLVTNELHPVTNGGCGTLILNSVFELLSKGFRVIVLADISPNLLRRFFYIMNGQIPYSENLKIISVKKLLQCGPVNNVKPEHASLRQSFRFYQALMALLREEHVDVIEFPDYFGWAYHTLAHFQSSRERMRPAIIVRFHLSIELIDGVTNWESYGLHRFLVYQLERYSLACSDRVLMASETVGKWVSDQYDKRLCFTVSTPSFAALKIIPRNMSSSQQIVLFYARLAAQKGAELFVDAALGLLDEGIDPHVRFIVAGPDMKQAVGGGSMVKYFRAQIPRKFQNRFEFPGNLNRVQWNTLLRDVLFTVMPTRIESYCYAARELVMAGVPTIVSNIPAFQDLIQEGACLSCQLDSADITKKMRMLLEDESLRKKLSTPWKPPPALGDVYQKIKPTPFIWEKKRISTTNALLTIVILVNKNASSQVLSKTIQSLDINKETRIWLAHANPKGSTVVMGRRCNLVDFKEGNLVSEPVEEALCILHAGDRLAPDFLPWALKMLSEYPSLGFVGGATQSSPPVDADNFPWDAAPEVLPFMYPGRLYRCIIRDRPNPFNQRMDPRLLMYQEIDAIWTAIEYGKHGVRRPDVCIKIAPESEKWMEIDYLTINSALHHLLSRHMKRNSSLQIPKVLKAVVHAQPFQTSDLLTSVRRGYIPEIGGTRLDLPNQVKLLMARLASLVKYI